MVESDNFSRYVLYIVLAFVVFALVSLFFSLNKAETTRIGFALQTKTGYGGGKTAVENACPSPYYTCNGKCYNPGSGYLTNIFVLYNLNKEKIDLENIKCDGKEFLIDKHIEYIAPGAKCDSDCMEKILELLKTQNDACRGDTANKLLDEICNAVCIRNKKCPGYRFTKIDPQEPTFDCSGGTHPDPKFGNCCVSANYCSYLGKCACLSTATA